MLWGDINIILIEISNKYTFLISKIAGYLPLDGDPNNFDKERKSLLWNLITNGRIFPQTLLSIEEKIIRNSSMSICTLGGNTLYEIRKKYF